MTCWDSRSSHSQCCIHVGMVSLSPYLCRVSSETEELRFFFFLKKSCKSDLHWMSCIEDGWSMSMSVWLIAFCIHLLQKCHNLTVCVILSVHIYTQAFRILDNWNSLWHTVCVTDECNLSWNRTLHVVVCAVYGNWSAAVSIENEANLI